MITNIVLGKEVSEVNGKKQIATCMMVWLDQLNNEGETVTFDLFDLRYDDLLKIYTLLDATINMEQTE